MSRIRIPLLWITLTDQCCRWLHFHSPADSACSWRDCSRLPCRWSWYYSSHCSHQASTEKHRAATLYPVSWICQTKCIHYTVILCPSSSLSISQILSVLLQWKTCLHGGEVVTKKQSNGFLFLNRQIFKIIWIFHEMSFFSVHLEEAPKIISQCTCC